MTVMSGHDSIGNQVQKAAAWRTIGFLSLSVSSYVVTVILARSFGPAAYGVYGIVYAVLASFELLLRLGIPQAMVKSMGADLSGDRRQEASGVTLIVGISLLAFCLLWLAAPKLADMLNIADGERLLRIAFLDIPVFSAYLAFSNVRLGRFEYRPVGMATGLYGLSRLAGVALLVATGSVTLEAALWVNILASFVGLAVVLSGQGYRPVPPSISCAKPLLISAFPIAMGEVGIEALIAVDLWMLNALGEQIPAEVKGWYVAAQSLARAPNLVSAVLVSLLVQSLARTIAEGRSEDARVLVTGCSRLLLVTLFPACALIAVNAREILSIMFSPSFSDGARFLAFLVISHGLFLTSMMVFQAMLIGGDRAGRGAWRIYAGLSAGILSSYLLISAFGGNGAGIGPILAIGVSTCLIAIAARSRYGVLVPARDLFRSLALTVAVSATSLLVVADGLWLLVELGILGLIYLAAAWWLGLILPTDLGVLRRKSS